MKHFRMERRRGPQGLRAERRGLGSVRRYFAAALLLFPLVVGSQHVLAQKRTITGPQKLPSAEKVVDGYLKAIGGKKSVALVRDSTYEWTIQLKDQTMGTARTELKAPGSVRIEMTFGNGQIISAANASSAWVRGLDEQLHTLTGAEAAAAKLQALLEASHLVNFKKLNVLARVVSVAELGSEPAYIVEFSTRGGARLRYWFGASHKLLLKIEDEARKTSTRFADYRPASSAARILVPHRVDLGTGGSGELTFLLQRVRYNVGDYKLEAPKAVEDPKIRP